MFPASQHIILNVWFPNRRGGGGEAGKLRAAQDPFLRRNVFATQLRLDTCGFTR